MQAQLLTYVRLRLLIDQGIKEDIPFCCPSQSHTTEEVILLMCLTHMSKILTCAGKARNLYQWGQSMMGHPASSSTDKIV